MSIDREKIEADIIAAGPISPATASFAALGISQRASHRCAGHAAALLAEVDRLIAIIGHEVFSPGIVATTEWTHHGGPDPYEGVDYLAVGREWLARREAMEQGKAKADEQKREQSHEH